MADMLSYLRWRGDISLESSPFNEVDNLLMSELSYINFSDIVDGLNNEQKITIEQAYKKYKVSKNTKHGFFSYNDDLLFEELAKSKRFSQALLSHYVDILDDTKKMTQFAAIKIEFNAGFSYIAFRGTDDSLIGWKEDFSFGYELSQAEKMAHQYLEGNIQADHTYYIGGHSKGGHLAIYVALMSNKDIQDRTNRIYSNDGPGICFDIISKIEYQEIEHKIVKFVPQFSIVGMLYEESDNITIIESNIKGIMQHDIFTWNVEGTQILRKRKFDKNAKECLHIINGFLEDSSSEQKKVFVESLFQSLSDKGFKTITDISNQGIDAFSMILESTSQSSKKSNHILLKLFKRIFSRLKVINYLEVLKTRKLYLSILIFLSGVLFIATPQHALRIIGTMFFIWLLRNRQIQPIYKRTAPHGIISP